jgi:ribonuclease G
MNIATRETCPTCNGTGFIQPSISAADILEKHLKFIISTQNERNLSIALHPFLHSFFTIGLISRRVKWMWKYKTSIKLIQDTSLGLMTFKFFDKNGEEIKLGTE